MKWDETLTPAERNRRAMRNANPPPEVVMATVLYVDEFRDFEGGPADFWDALDPELKRAAELTAARVIRARKQYQPKSKPRRKR
jgi:hypothetical protein